MVGAPPAESVVNLERVRTDGLGSTPIRAHSIGARSGSTRTRGRSSTEARRRPSSSRSWLERRRAVSRALPGSRRTLLAQRSPARLCSYAGRGRCAARDADTVVYARVIVESAALRTGPGAGFRIARVARRARPFASTSEPRAATGCAWSCRRLAGVRAGRRGLHARSGRRRRGVRGFWPRSSRRHRCSTRTVRSPCRWAC